MLILIQIAFQLVNSLDFDHPEKPTIFYWNIKYARLQYCNLKVENKKLIKVCIFTLILITSQIIIVMTISGK